MTRTTKQFDAEYSRQRLGHLDGWFQVKPRMSVRNEPNADYVELTASSPGDEQYMLRCTICMDTQATRFTKFTVNKTFEVYQPVGKIEKDVLRELMSRCKAIQSKVRV